MFKTELAVVLVRSRIAGNLTFGGSIMKEMMGHLEKLRGVAAECEMIKDSATDEAKRELFNRLARHYKVLAGEVERAIRSMGNNGKR
jgi:hypothetical protein